MSASIQFSIGLSVEKWHFWANLICSAPCDLLSISLTDYYGYPLLENNEGVFLTDSSIQGNPTKWKYSSRLKAIPKDIIVGLYYNLLILQLKIQKKGKDRHTCIIPEDDSLSLVDGHKECSSCEDYLSLYSHLGYKPSSLISSLSIVHTFPS